MTSSGPRVSAPVTTEEEAHAIGIEAYTYAYPMVVMELTRRVATNVAQPDGARVRGPMNRFVHVPAYPDASFKDVVRPNADTLYSNIWYDVGESPLMLTLPDTGDRYHVIPFYDLWTDVFATLGTRTNGNGGGRFALVGPRWKGTLPEGVRAIVSPTDVGWIVGRIQTNGAADYAHVHTLQAGFEAASLSDGGKPPAPGRVDPAMDMRPPVEQVAALDAGAFFALFAELLKRNPPHAADGALLLRMERIGLVAGRSFSLAQAPEVVQRALERAAPDAYRRMLDRAPALRMVRNGWSFGSNVGVYGNDYLARAFVAHSGLGALPREEALYPRSVCDSDGQPLSGAARYVLHFDKEQLPPADAFWSLSLYGPDQFFVDNALDRYAIGDRDALSFNADGSLDLYIQHASPGEDKTSNWLPAPAGPFSMNLRLYVPQAPALDGRWAPPVLQRLP
ncbi:DUF1254 domain-containing protein [Acidovorax cavernicola]|uniref:DUF1254 domain-containing protein n=1 Tax=Acidovorax cavernicola TaxID=1675792 RepID=A0A9X8GUT8_9BURK|nr:DUF1254 domain-containing protein [Acidovorax cavernicola]RIX79057.1 DUF1254 domain-containing protein [Acidovorax cavernicola]